MAKPIPEGYHTLTPTIAFKDARKAIDFYKKAFGAKEKSLIPGPNGKGVMHAEIQIGDSMVRSKTRLVIRGGSLRTSGTCRRKK